jgi:hypothetical protein
MRKPIIGPTRVWLVDRQVWREAGCTPEIFLSKAGTKIWRDVEIIPGTFTPDKPKAKKRRKKS